jgi:hypothetical protein
MGLHIRPGDAKALEFYNSYFGKLVGAKILAFQMVPDEEDPDFPDYQGDLWPSFKVELKDGRIIQIEISQDEEGNGPGFIFGLDLA